MSDWQIGDLAVCVSLSWGKSSVWNPEVGCIYTVAGLDEAFDDDILLELAEDPLAFDPEAAWDANDFRKIRPDEQEACEPEFITLLNRSKVPETASDWLIRVGQLAKQLNAESAGDCPSGTVATQASPRAGSRLGHSVSVNYRRGEEA